MREHIRVGLKTVGGKTTYGWAWQWVTNARVFKSEGGGCDHVKYDSPPQFMTEFGIVYHLRPGDWVVSFDDGMMIPAGPEFFEKHFEVIDLVEKVG